MSDSEVMARFPELEKQSSYQALQSIKKGELLREIEKLRGSILDSAQFFFEDHPSWKPFRSRLLTLLGRKGFERTVSDIVCGQLFANRGSDEQ